MKVLTEKRGKVDAFWVSNFLELSYVGNTYKYCHQSFRKLFIRPNEGALLKKV